MEGVGFTETNPDKGTETRTLSPTPAQTIVAFTETNPDKGTETGEDGYRYMATRDSLQKLTPIRGRKP